MKRSGYFVFTSSLIIYYFYCECSLPTNRGCYVSPADRNEIQSKFSNAILEMQQKSGLKYMVLEKKIAAMREELDIKDAHLHQLSHSDKSGQGNVICTPRKQIPRKVGLLTQYTPL